MSTYKREITVMLRLKMKGTGSSQRTLDDSTIERILERTLEEEDDVEKAMVTNIKI